jgi:hypothetical protein
VNVTQADRHRREAIIADHSAPHKHVFILATADGCGTAEIMCRSHRQVPMQVGPRAGTLRGHSAMPFRKRLLARLALVAAEPVDALGHEPRLPSPHYGLRFARSRAIKMARPRTPSSMLHFIGTTVPTNWAERPLSA